MRTGGRRNKPAVADKPTDVDVADAVSMGKSIGKDKGYIARPTEALVFARSRGGMRLVA